MIGSGGRRLALAGVAVGLVAVGGLLALSVSLVTTNPKDRPDLTVVVGPGGSTAPAPVLTPRQPATSRRTAAEAGGAEALADVSGGTAGPSGGAGPARVVPVARVVRPRPGRSTPRAPRLRRTPAPRPAVAIGPPAVVVVPAVGAPTPIALPVAPVVAPVTPPDAISPPPPSTSPFPPTGPSPPPADTDEPDPGDASPPTEGTEPGGGVTKPPPASSVDCPPDPSPPDPCPPDPCPPDPCPPEPCP